MITVTFFSLANSLCLKSMLQNSLDMLNMGRCDFGKKSAYRPNKSPHQGGIMFTETVVMGNVLFPCFQIH